MWIDERGKIFYYLLGKDNIRTAIEQRCIPLIELITTLSTGDIHGMVLSQDDIDGCRQAFLAFDKDRSGDAMPLSPK